MYSDFLFLIVSILVVCIFLGIYPFNISYLVIFHVIVHTNPLFPSEKIPTHRMIFNMGSCSKIVGSHCLYRKKLTFLLAFRDLHHLFSLQSYFFQFPNRNSHSVKQVCAMLFGYPMQLFTCLGTWHSPCIDSVSFSPSS